MRMIGRVKKSAQHSSHQPVRLSHLVQTHFKWQRGRKLGEGGGRGREGERVREGGREGGGGREGEGGREGKGRMGGKEGVKGGHINTHTHTRRRGQVWQGV